MSNQVKGQYGDLPIDLGEVDINWNESCFYLYLPIKMADDFRVLMPDRLIPFKPLVAKAVNSFLGTDQTNPNAGPINKEIAEGYLRSYVYLTVKHMLVNPNFWGNRGGAHCDGFGTNDWNFIWYDKNPTEFNSTKFKVSDDEVESLEQFNQQWDYKNVVTYPEKHLLQLSPFVVHRVAPVTRYDMRTFVKISISEHKYNLVGNSHNHLFDYDWEMYDRVEIRNRTHNNNQDYVPEDVA